MDTITSQLNVDENPYGKPSDRPETVLPSRYQIGAKVWVNFNDSGSVKNCSVIKVHFTQNKVQYDLEVLCHYAKYPKEKETDEVEYREDFPFHARLYNVDSSLIIPHGRLYYDSPVETVVIS